MANTDPDRQKLIHLRKLLIGHFDLEELRLLCFDLGLDYEELAGRTKSTKMQDLITYLKRRGELKRLLDEVNSQRPNIPWPEFAPTAEDTTTDAYTDEKAVQEITAPSFADRENQPTVDLVDPQEKKATSPKSASNQISSPPEKSIDKRTQISKQVKKNIIMSPAVAIATFNTSYSHGHSSYDDTFNIYGSNGEFLGECGVGIALSIGDDRSQNVSAFEIWLFHKEPVRTITKVVLSYHAFHDHALSGKVGAKGELVMASAEEEIVLTLNDLVLKAKISDLQYRVDDSLQPNSAFNQINFELSVFSKPSVIFTSQNLTPPKAGNIMPFIRRGRLPEDFRWCWVPGGHFFMGSEEEIEEEPMHEAFVDGFWMARYPVTNAQFRLFVESGGYGKHRWWSEAGWQWREHWGRMQPYLWENINWGKNSQHPVVGVSCYEAEAFCLWIAELLGYQIRLPTELEWEKAARGIDKRRYPWGDKNPSKNLCNFKHSKWMKVPSIKPVGKYSPAGDSPYGCADMAGNIWEWTTSRYISYPGNQATNWPFNQENYVIRGSCFREDDGDKLRSSLRKSQSPAKQDVVVGFRCACLPA